MIFVDTGAFLARYLAADQHHANAVATWQTLADDGIPLCTSNFVIDETLTLLARRAGYRFAAERGQVIYRSKQLRVLRPTADDEHRSLGLFAKYADQNVSFTDCISFALMRTRSIRKAFSFDRHFVYAGFEPYVVEA